MIATLFRMLAAIGRWAKRQQVQRTRHDWDYYHAPVRCTQCGELYQRFNYDEECTDKD